jgi:hypothetical protein
VAAVGELDIALSLENLGRAASAAVAAVAQWGPPELLARTAWVAAVALRAV